jgi:hypothetical protein
MEQNENQTNELINSIQPPRKFFWVKVLIIFVIVVIVGVLSFWLYSKIKQKNIENKIKNDATTAQKTKDELEKTMAEMFKKNTEVISKIDRDMDGLTDVEEQKYGTNLDSPDTDSDGILDKDEVNIYKTNPNKADTDGDGYKDGDEVRNDFNPNGPGQLVR